MKSASRILLAFVILALLTGVTFLLRPVSFFNGSMYLREYTSGVENHSIQIDGHRVHYLAAGPANGPVVVLVHGLGGHAEDWRALSPVLVRAGFRVYMPDLLGYGRSDKPTDFSYSVHDEANFVVSFLDALGLKQVNLGGWSMGGWIVELIAAQHPDRVARLVLFDAAGLNIKPAWNTALFTPASADEVAQLDALLMPNPPHVPAFTARDIVRVSHRDGWIIQRALAEMLTARDVTDNLLPQLKMPVLIAWGGLDRITPLDQAQTMHSLIPQSQLDIAAGCGHLAPLQCANQFGPEVIEFFQQ